MRVISNVKLKDAADKAARRWAGGTSSGEPAQWQSHVVGNKKNSSSSRSDHDTALLTRIFGKADSELDRLAKALRTERRLGQAGHWSYDLNRHIALAQSYRLELDKTRIKKSGPHNSLPTADDQW